VTSPIDANGAPGRAAGRPPASRVLRVIASYKFAKAALVTLAGLGALKLLDPKVVALLNRWAAALARGRVRYPLARAISWLTGLRPHRLETLAVGAFLFALLFIVEGVGLWLLQRWAQYLTVTATTLLVPFEVLQLVHAVSPARIVVLALNVALVGVLVYVLERHPAPGAEERAGSAR